MKNFFKNFIHIIFLFFIVYLCVWSPISAQTKEVDFTELEKTINEELAATKTPGASVAVISGDKIIFAKGFGTTSAENGNPVTADTLFRLGSTTHKMC